MISKVCMCLTALIIGLGIFGIAQVGVPESLNEIGDAVAGFTGALALVLVL